MTRVLDGNRIRDEIKAECLPRVERFTAKNGRPPGLAVVLAGDNPASQLYVRNKTRTAVELGIYSETITPDPSADTDALLRLVGDLNARPEIDGILVQLPLPKPVDELRVLLAVDPAKDVDGFHPCNMGLLATGRPGLRPCTPAGVIEILRRSAISMAGKHAVIIGRSTIVGKPMALLLLAEDATVTICHSKTHDLPAVCRSADILVAAIGRPAMVTANYMKPGAVIVDVGINKVTDASTATAIFGASPAGAARLNDFHKRGSVLVGDVHPLDMADIASACTPVPGGVGPLTIAMLMRNTIEAAERRTALCS